MTMLGLTPACAHVRQLHKWDGLFLPTAHSPDLAPSNYHLFGPVRDALCGCHFADDYKLKEVFVMCYVVKTGNFTTLVYSVLLNTGKSVLKIMKTLWKNTLIIVKAV
jgi:hypothetical protein